MIIFPIKKALMTIKKQTVIIIMEDVFRLLSNLKEKAELILFATL